MQNPIAKMREFKTFTELARGLDISRQHLQKMSQMTPDELSGIPVRTILGIESSLGIDLITYIKE